MKKNIPNILSFCRLLFIPVFLFFAYRGQKDIVGFCLILSGLTDSLDGFLARRWRLESKFGAALDTIADTTSVVAGIVALWILDPSIAYPMRPFTISLSLLGLVYLCLAQWRTGTVGYHYWTSKLMGIACVFFLIYAVFFGFHLWAVLIWFGFTTVGLGELVLSLILGIPNQSTRSIFSIEWSPIWRQERKNED